MRRGFLALMIAVGSAGAAGAQTADRWIERDQYGRRTGTVERQRNGDLVRRDAQGRRTGTDERRGDDYVRKDAMGRVTGRVTRDR